MKTHARKELREKRNFYLLGHFTQGPHAVSVWKGGFHKKGMPVSQEMCINFENWKLQLAIMLPKFRDVLFHNQVVFSVLASESLSRLWPSAEGKRKRKRQAVGWAYDKGGARREGHTLLISHGALFPWLTLLLYSQYSLCTSLFVGILITYQSLWWNKMYVNSEK